jgi:hypothetical protein
MPVLCLCLLCLCYAYVYYAYVYYACGSPPLTPPATARSTRAPRWTAEGRKEGKSGGGNEIDDKMR